MKKLFAAVLIALFTMMLPIQSVSAAVYEAPLITSIQPYIRITTLGYLWSSPGVVYSTYNYPGKNVQITTTKTTSYPVIKIVKVPVNWSKLESTSVPVCTPVVTSPSTPPVTTPAPSPTTSAPTTPASTPAPTPAPAPTPTPVNDADFTAMQREMLGYINAERAKVNAAPLTLDQALCDGATLKSKDMAVNGYFSHTSPTYGSPFDMMKSLGISYRAAGENIAKNSSVKGAHDAFMNSSGHRANILNTAYHKVGLGFYQDGYYLYVTQWFTD